MEGVLSMTTHNHDFILPLFTFIRRSRQFRQCPKQFKASCPKRLIIMNGGSS